jgi:tRNA N6-adenosine threonylcarbamoyltransferase
MKTVDVFLGVLVFLHLKPLTKSYRMRSLISFPKGCNLFFDGMNTLTCRGSIRERSMKLSAQPASQRNGLGKPKGYWDVKSRYTLEQHTLSGLPDRSKPFLVLGIESSCDDTGAAIVRSDGVVLSNVVYSQYEIHQRFGGIVPSLAMEAHKGNIEKAVAEALKQAGLSSLQEVDAIAVTKGPGLEICLRVGFKKAQVHDQSTALLHALGIHIITEKCHIVPGIFYVGDTIAVSSIWISLHRI